MNTSLLCGLLLILAVLLSSARLCWNYFHTVEPQRPRVWRITMLIVLQLASAALLYFSLFPPPQQSTAERLVVVTAKANASAIKNVRGRVIALPEAPPFAGVERVADLASALRKYPGVGSVDIIGDGLPHRDIDAARNLSVSYSPAKLPEGIIDLAWSERVSPGMRWWLRGRVNYSQAVTVELLDPSGVVIDHTQINARKDHGLNRGLVAKDAHAAFVLSDTARAAGQANYQLRILDAQKKIRETVLVPLLVERVKPLRILSIAGGPNPELKYLRRWASDAGIAFESRVELGRGMQIQTANSTLSASSLRDVDLLILDERAWSAMSASNKNAVLESLNAGLGVLLRLTGALSSNSAGELRQLGFTVADSAITQGVRLPETQGKQQLPELSRRPVRVQSADGMALLQTDKAEPLAIWRAQGQGRIALWWLTDSYKLALSNAADVHGQLWSEAASTLARSRTQAGLESRQQHLWVNQRGVYCGLAESARVQEPSGQFSALVVDTEAVNSGCAAFWPRQPGWHHLISDSNSLRFYVRASAEAAGLKFNALREANRQLLGNRMPQYKPALIAVPAPHWPYFVFWLLLTALLWMLERSKWGFKRPAATM